MSTTADPWIHVLQQLEPLYFKWKDILEQGSKVHANLIRKGRQWCIVLNEEPITNFGRLDERVEWTDNQLKDWSNVKRMSHDMWYFKHKHDAEKFQTLYNLKWAGE